jgi:hypothetical protein
MVSGSNTTQLPTISSAANTGFTNQSLANFCPPNSSAVDFNASNSTNISNWAVAPNGNYSLASIAAAPQFVVFNSVATAMVLAGRIQLETQNISTVSSVGTLTVNCVGGEINL